MIFVRWLVVRRWCRDDRLHTMHVAFVRRIAQLGIGVDGRCLERCRLHRLQVDTLIRRHVGLLHKRHHRHRTVAVLDGAARLLLVQRLQILGRPELQILLQQRLQVRRILLAARNFQHNHRRCIVAGLVATAVVVAIVPVDGPIAVVGLLDFVRVRRLDLNGGAESLVVWLLRVVVRIAVGQNGRIVAQVVQLLVVLLVLFGGRCVVLRVRVLLILWLGEGIATKVIAVDVRLIAISGISRYN